MAIKAPIEVEVGTLTLEAEAETQALIKALVHLIPHLNMYLSTNNSSRFRLQHSHPKLLIKARMRDLHARSVGRWDTMLLIVTTG
jgi:hypothetical protein